MNFNQEIVFTNLNPLYVSGTFSDMTKSGKIFAILGIVVPFIMTLGVAMVALYTTRLVTFDQMLDAMYTVGRRMPAELRGTALGGYAATPAACAVCGHCG